MPWSSYLKTKTRDPAFLWRMVLWIIGLGMLLGLAAQVWFQPGGAAMATGVDSSESWKSLELIAKQGEWRQLWWALPRVVYRRFDIDGANGLAALAGCCWMAFLLHALKVRRLRDGRLWCAIVALPLGVLSIWPTHFFSFWQEQVWNLRDSRELVPGVCFYVLGVGLREELAKLLCLLPLMPLLLRMRSELTAMLVASSVGMGFAVAENVGYISGSRGGATMARFLMANPFHMTLTGLAGLALYRGLRSPKDWGSHAVSTFGLVVIAHGLYDAFLGVAVLAEYAMFTTIVFALVVYQFFRELRALRPSGGDVVSLSANFLCGVSLLTAATFVYLSATQGCSAAFEMLAQGVIGLGVMVYLFLREMPETMVRV